MSTLSLLVRVRCRSKPNRPFRDAEEVRVEKQKVSVADLDTIDYRSKGRETTESLDPFLDEEKSVENRMYNNVYKKRKKPKYVHLRATADIRRLLKIEAARKGISIITLLDYYATNQF